MILGHKFVLKKGKLTGTKTKTGKRPRKEERNEKTPATKLNHSFQTQEKKNKKDVRRCLLPRLSMGDGKIRGHGTVVATKKFGCG